MSTFISDTIEKPATKQKNTINIKCIIANIAQANILYSGTTCTTFWTNSCLNSYNKYKNQNDSMGGKNKNEFKYHILTTYLVNQTHTEPVPCYNLETIVDYGYALYKRRGRYMHLVDIIPLIKIKNKIPLIIESRHTTD
ncbi:hypothetical protein [Xenorhabdus cabanillasii]|uniref:Uncharacterized protein n=1 Tax=Xenorhabdus cabanillasii JM26 TaxID=1427517 RepID=W1IV54_9GAMM|nr:hypothetical protein [Xenorhabdus cabanillasii]PHM75483.1 hypothetical protein Xcab_04043 [Xenorhabdus cabanillasii JM26]CDL82377.1 hypothetical protein XCR1_1660005 [Xenorhabdus cabanillasii JM26]